MEKNSAKVNFEVKATIVEELGRNLYSADNSIIVELIANSYDADATTVKIKFDPSNDEITITDNGSGMSFETVKRDFLTIGDRDRESQRLSTTKKFGRRRLGRKGIGRLSFFALGSNIRVETAHHGEKLVFSLHFDKLSKGNEEILVNRVDDDKTAPFIDGTKITISKLQDGINKGTFLKQMVVGIGHVFNDLLKENSPDSFEILISSNEDDLIKDMVSQQEYAIKKVDPDFSKTLIFYSLDPDADQTLEKVKKFNSNHIAKMCAATGLVESDLVDYMDSKASKDYFEKNNRDSGLQTFSTNSSGKRNDFFIRGYIASIVTTKNLGEDLAESSQSNDDVKVDEKSRTLNIVDSNRRISISSKGRAGNLNAKGSLRLADKFYTKYLFGNVVAPMFEDPEFGPDMALPNREGYKTTDLRWEYLRAYLKILGDKAMSFSNDISKTKRKKAEENNGAFLRERMDDLRSKVFNKKIDEVLWTILVKYYFEAARKKIELSPELAERFLIISYKSGDSQFTGSSFKNAVLLNTILKEIFLGFSRVKIFFAPDINTLEPDQRLYPTLKDEMWSSGTDFRVFHMFCMLSDEYVNNWYTDIEYGMAYSQSDMSKHLVPSNITTFISDGDKPLKTRLGKFDPVSYETVKFFTKEYLIKVLTDMCEKMSLKGFNTLIVSSVNKHFSL